MAAEARSLRASQEAVIRGVMPLGNCSMHCSTSCIHAVVVKGWPFPARHALRLTASWLAECYRIGGGVHSTQCIKYKRPTGFGQIDA